MVGISLTAAVWVTLSFGSSNRICKGVTIEGVYVGGLSKDQCREAASAWAIKQAGKHIVLTALDSRWTGALSNFGARLDWSKAADQAYAVGRQGKFISRMICVLVKNSPGKRISMPVAVDPSIVQKTIHKVAKTVNRPHKDARLKNVDGNIEITQDASGIKLDEKGSVKTVIDTIKANKMVASLPVTEDIPDVTTKDASGIDTLLARYTTTFNPGKRNRTHNLMLAARAISGVVVPNGLGFSYNAIVGPRIGARGFLEAPIFVNGKMEPGVGGGICQVSSTLYNTVLMTGLKVIERYPHSRTVPYVTAGRDATVAYGMRDFRFNNPMTGAVGILTHLSKASLTVDIYGAASDKKNITIFTGPVSHTPTAGTKTVYDPSLPAGARKVVDKGSRGARVTVYRRINSLDGTSVTETVSTDRYPAQKVIIGVGPNAKPPVATNTSITSSSDAPTARTD